jgi:hypothetical protein
VLWVKSTPANCGMNTVSTPSSTGPPEEQATDGPTAMLRAASRDADLRNLDNTMTPLR